jgi:hypothetical protein
MAEDQWYSVAVPILEYVHARGEPFWLMSVGEIALETGLDPNVVAVELERLQEAGYVTGPLIKVTSSGDDLSGWFLRNSSLSERGMRALGAWPSDDPYDALVALLERHIATTSDEAKKSKLRALQSSVAEVGKATVAGLLVELAKGGGHF